MRKQRFGKTLSWPALVALACILAACAAESAKITDYFVPAGAPTARLLVRPTLGSNMAYTLLAFDDGDACTHAQRVVKPETSSANQSTVIRAGAHATMRYIGAYRKEYCSTYFSFEPKAGHTYLLATYQDTNGCAVNLLDASDGDAPKPEKSYVKLAKQGNVCVPASARADGSKGAAPSTNAANALGDFKDLLPAQ